MSYQIDQSNKIEQTNRKTVIGLSNDRSFTLEISSRSKQVLQREFRSLGKPRLFVYRTFIACVVFVTLKAKIESNANIIIDKEYLHKEKLLHSMFTEMWNKVSRRKINIRFSLIGKSSNAHKISYLTMKGKLNANYKLSLKEVRKLALNKNPDA